MPKPRVQNSIGIYINEVLFLLLFFYLNDANAMKTKMAKIKCSRMKYIVYVQILFYDKQITPWKKSEFIVIVSFLVDR